MLNHTLKHPNPHTMLRYPSAILLLLLPVLWQTACQHTPTDTGLSPAEALATLEVMEGFEVALVASDPLISDPVAMEIDEEGRVYVVEMPGYPLDLTRTGRVKLLEDSDGDGVWDRSRVFADNLTLPTGIMRWKNGVLVTDAPDVVFLADTNGDGRADIREVILTGFALSNPQHNFNTPVYGLDNWIYVANENSVTSVGFQDLLGDEGTEIYFPAQNAKPRLAKNGGDRNIRFRPDTYELEMRAGHSQYGHTFNLWGQQFSTNNATHLWHEVLAAPYLDRKPELWAASASQYIPAYGRPAEVFPLTDQPIHQLLTDVGVFTSACGITWYQGGAFPQPFEEVIFTGEPTHNLVHADIVRPDGATFAAARLLENREFLRSTDSWFRPVSFYTGPAGELYVIDYYRKIIEHPEWMSEEVNNSGQLYHGSTQGRIYRVTATNQQEKWQSPSLEGLSDGELVKLLASRNGWYRRTAQRMLVDRQDSGAAADLEAMLKTHASPVARVHALWTLDGLGLLSESMITRALQDEAAGVRENALRLTEKHIARFPGLKQVLLSLGQESDPRVRFQLICTLGGLGGMEFEPLLIRLLHAQQANDWSVLALLTGSAGEQIARSFLIKKSQDADLPAENMEKLAYRLGEMDGMQGDWAGIRRSLSLAKSGQPYMASSISGIARGLRTRRGEQGDSEAEKARVLQLAMNKTGPLRSAAMELLEVLGLPKAIDTNALTRQLTTQLDAPESDVETQTIAMRLLANMLSETALPVFETHLTPAYAAPVQRAAIQAMGQQAGTAVCMSLISRWDQFTPDLRDDAVGVLMQSTDRMACLLDAVDAGTIEPSTLGWRRMVRLMNHDHLPTRERARALLVKPEQTEAEVLKKFAAVPTQKGDAKSGLAVFTRLCSSCHQVQGQDGHAFGPDLASVRHRQPESLMADILLPQRSIADGYELWIAQTKGGETFSGIIVSDAAAGITLRDAAGQETQIRRADLASLEASDYSAMTAGIGELITVEEMTNLIAYLKRWPELRTGMISQGSTE